MIIKDLDKIKWNIGQLRVDNENLKVSVINRYNQKEYFLQNGTKVRFRGQEGIEYRNIESVGFFKVGNINVNANECAGIEVWLPKVINQELRDFLYEYVDRDTLNILVDELKKYEVTLYDCISFFSSEVYSEGFVQGTNSIQFHSEETFEYCYVIHRFKIDEKIGKSVYNEFEFISINGDKHFVNSELILFEDEVSEEDRLDKELMEYYKESIKEEQ